MKRKFLSMLSITMAASMMFMVGCTSSDSKAPSTSSSSSSASSDKAEYAIVLKTQASDFWVKMKEGIEAKAKELGVKVDIQAAQSEEDTEGQLKILESMVSNGNYKAIGVAPLSPVNLIKGVAEASKKGIYVMNIDEKFDMDQLKSQGGSVIGFATTDNVAVGKKGGQYIVDNVPKGSEVAIIEGKAGNASGENRKNGAKAAFEAAGLKVVASLPADWDRQKALDITTSYIQQYPNLKGIYCANDGMALGAVQAVSNTNNIGKILIVGTDGDKEAVDSVNKGMLSATVAQDPAGIGAASLEAMVNAVKNKAEIKSDSEVKTIPIDSKLIIKK